MEDLTQQAPQDDKAASDNQVEPSPQAEEKPVADSSPSQPDNQKADSSSDQAPNDGQIDRDEALATLLLEREISNAQKKYPDTPDSILESAALPGQAEALAKAYSESVEKSVKKRLAELTNVPTPTLSKEDKAAKLKELRDNPGRDSLQKAIAL